MCFVRFRVLDELIVRFLSLLFDWKQLIINFQFHFMLKFVKYHFKKFSTNFNISYSIGNQQKYHEIGCRRSRDFFLFFLFVFWFLFIFLWFFKIIFWFFFIFLNPFPSHEKIIPPKKFRPKSLPVKENRLLYHVHEQNISKYLKDWNEETLCHFVSFENKRKVKYEDFRNSAMAKDVDYVSWKKCEEEYWRQIDDRILDSSLDSPLYAIDNRMTLFPKDQKLWNLNAFTNEESIIHNVSSLKFSKIFTYFKFPMFAKSPVH